MDYPVGKAPAQVHGVASRHRAQLGSGERMRRKDKERDAGFAWDVLERCPYAVLALADGEGSPYCVPISPVVINGCIYFHCASIGRKIRLLHANPRVCVTAVCDERPVAEKFAMDFSSAIVEGTAEEVTDEAEKERMLLALCQRYAAANLEGFQMEVGKFRGRTGVWRVVPNAIAGKCSRM